MTGIWLLSYILLWVLVIALGIVVVSVMRNLGVLYTMLSSTPRRRGADSPLSGLTRGDPLPEVSWVTASGEVKSPADFRGSKMGFAIVSPSCDYCAKFLSVAFHDGPDPLDRSLRDFVIVSVGDMERTASLLNSAGAPKDAVVLFDRDGDVARKWGVTTTPGMVIVDENMRVETQVFGANAGKMPVEEAVGTHT